MVMTMDMTPRWELPHLYAGQAQKELFYNEAVWRIDMLLHGEVESDQEATPPAAPEIGQSWIVAAGATGAWDDRAGYVACWTDGGWRFIAPKGGLCLWVKERGCGTRYEDAIWRDEVARTDGIYVDGERVVGPRLAGLSAPSGGPVVDTEGRAAINGLLAILREHGLIAT